MLEAIAGRPHLENAYRAALDGRYLRITSQTGSGKTLAIGFAVRDLAASERPARRGGAAHPRVLVLTPTRETVRGTADALASTV